MSAAVQANHAKLGRRLFNTHLRWEMMPRDHAEARYVYMVRRGADACVSFYHHLTHQTVEEGGYDGSFDEFAADWTGGRAPFGSWTAHLASWLCRDGPDAAAPEADPRVLVLSYEELKADVRGCVCRINEHCGFGLDEGQLEALLPRFSFAWMREHEQMFHPRSVTWLEGRGNARGGGDAEGGAEGGEGEGAAFHFLRAGRVGDGDAAFTAAHREQLRVMLARTFPAGDTLIIITELLIIIR